MRALVLAAGEGRRFGGPKQLAVVDGRTLLEHAVALAAPWDPLVVLGAHAPEILERVRLERYVIAEDWASGQSSSLRAGVAALGDVDAALVFLADQPFLTREVVEGVLALGPPARAVYDGAPGHPVLLGREQLAAVPALRGDEGARSLLAGARTFEAAHLCDPTDIDTPEALPPMKMTQTFEVNAPIEEVWTALIDVERVAPCLPGAAITEVDADGTYKGEFTVKLGPTTAAYRGTVKIGELDESAHCATLHARGTDKRGQGGATATIVNTMVSIEGGTRVTADTDFTITGRLARFGRGGMIQDISNRMLRDFAACLQKQLEATPPPQAASPAGPGTPAPAPTAAPAQQSAPPVKGISLFFSVLFERIKRVFKR